MLREGPDRVLAQTSKFEKKVDILFRFQIDSYLDGNLIQKIKLLLVPPGRETQQKAKHPETE